MSKFTYIDLFSGIGGFRIAIDSLGGKSVGFSEIDKPALETYKANFHDPRSHDLGDVTKITELPQVDMIVGGVPCQSWSVAGKKRGFDDPRGKLWYDAIRTVELAKPKVFIFENVKGLYDPRNKANLELIVESLEERGYIVKYQLLNCYDYGVPQNRSRIFIVGFRSDLADYADSFEYPEPQESHVTVADLLDGFKKKNFLKKKFEPRLIHGDTIPKSRNAFQKEDELNDFFVFCDTRNGHSTIHSWDLYKTSDRQKMICNTVLANRRKKKYGDADGNPLSFEDLAELVPKLKIEELDKLVGKKILRKVNSKYELVNSKNSSGIDGVYRIFLPNSNIFSTLTATGTRDFVATDYVKCNDPSEYKTAFIEQIYKQNKFRQITPREAARVQGFPENFVCHTKDFSAHKQFGNAVSPPVVKALVTKICETGILKSNADERIRTRDYTWESQRMVPSEAGS